MKIKKFFKKAGRSLSGRGGQNAALTVLIVAVAVALNVLLYTLTLSFNLVLGSPHTDDLSISDAGDALFAEAIERDKQVTITFLDAEDSVATHATGGFVLETARNIKERYPDFVKLRFVNIITGIDHETKQKVDLSKYTTDMQGEKTAISRTSVIFESGINYRVLTDTYTAAGYADFFTLSSYGTPFAYNGEEVMLSMMCWVLNNVHKTVYFTQGHGESADVAFTNLLSCMGYFVEVIDIKKNEIPEDADLVIISNPQNDFERADDTSRIRAEINRLEAFVKRGGNLYVSLDPYAKEMSELVAFLGECGITVTGGKSEGGNYAKDIIKDNTNAITTDGLSFVAEFAQNDFANTLKEKTEKYAEGGVLLSDVSRIEANSQLGAEALLISSSSSVAVRDGEVQDREGGYTVAALSKPTVFGNDAGRVFVVSGVLMTSGDLLASDVYANKEFTISLFDTQFDAEVSPYGCNTVLTATTTLQNLTMGEARIYTAVILAVPVLIAAVGAVFIIRRKNR